SAANSIRHGGTTVISYPEGGGESGRRRPAPGRDDVSEHAQGLGTRGQGGAAAGPTTEPCVLLVLGASGDLTKRLLVPALYNLACDGLLSDRVPLLGAALGPLTTPSVTARLAECT